MRPQLLLVVLTAWATVQGQTIPSVRQKQAASIEGIVINALTGEPLNHAHVTLDNYSRQPSGKYGTMTTSEGRFSITSLVPGSYNARTERRGYLLSANKQNSAGTVAIDLKPGEQIRDFELKMVPAAVISGRVLDENDAPMENVMVEAIRGRNMSSAETNEGGEFRIGGLRAGRYLIKARRLGSRLPPEIRTDGSTESYYGPTYYPATASRDSASIVRARAGAEVDGINIRLSQVKIVRVSGIVSGVPKNTQGVNVTLSSGNSGQGIPLGRDLRFTVWRLPPGTHGLWAQCWIDGQPQQSAMATFEVSDSNIDNIDLALMKPFEVQGRVETHLDARGQQPPGPKLQLSLGPMAGRVKEDGSFTLENAQPGRYRVRLVGLPEDRYIKSISVGLAEFPGAILDVRTGPPPAPIVITLGQGAGEISGIVRDQKGRPTSGIVALLADDSYGIDANTFFAGPDGSYTIRGIAPGGYKLFAFEIGDVGVTDSEDGIALYKDVTEKIEMREGDKITQDLKLVASED